MKRMRAKFAGTCRDCGTRIDVGDLIDWSRTTGAVHAESCHGATDDVRVTATDHHARREAAEYAAGVADAERYMFNRRVFGDAYADAEEIAWERRLGW